MEDRHAAFGLSIGIIMDGNGRWAKSRGLPRSAGHKKGADVFDDITHYAEDCGVKSITYYVFSTENWARPKKELDNIMNLFGKSLKTLYKYIDGNNRVVFLGSRSGLKPAHVDMMEDLQNITAEHTGLTLNVAVNYGGRQELTRAARNIAKMVQNGEINPEDIDEKCMEDNLYTKGQPMPDLIIRTSGEQRISNFLLWQCAYSEFIFTDTLWPDFTRSTFDEMINEYHRRQRRFGGI